MPHLPALHVLAAPPAAAVQLLPTHARAQHVVNGVSAEQVVKSGAAVQGLILGGCQHPVLGQHGVAGRS